MKLVLSEPIPMGDLEPLRELNFREKAQAGDLRGIKVNSLSDPLVDDILKVAARLCAQPEVVIMKLSLGDLAEVVNLVGTFLQGGQKTGNTPSP